MWLSPWASQRLAWRGAAWHGVAGRGAAWRGEAWSDVAGRGRAWNGARGGPYRQDHTTPRHTTPSTAIDG